MSDRNKKSSVEAVLNVKGGLAAEVKLDEEGGRLMVTLDRVEEVKARQRAEGNFDCFGTAFDNYCDQGECLYHSECLTISAMIGPPAP